MDFYGIGEEQYIPGLGYSSWGPESYPGSSLHYHTLPYSFTSTKYARGKYILTCFLCICLNTCTGRCTPRPIPCSLTSASTVSHQVVACVTTVGGILSKCCSRSVINLAIGWISQIATVHNCEIRIHHVNLCYLIHQLIRNSSFISTYSVYWLTPQPFRYKTILWSA